MPILLRLVRRNKTTEITKGATIARKSVIFRKNAQNLQKVVLVLATSMLIIDNIGKEVAFEKIPCIHYPV